MSLFKPQPVSLPARTAFLIMAFFLIASGSPVHSQTTARFLSKQQWEADIQIVFSPEGRDGEPKIDRLLSDRLLQKLKAQGVACDLRKQAGENGGLAYGLQLRGSEGRGQFRKALFTATDPTLPFTEGPALLHLIGTIKPGEPLDLVLDSNLASGFAWEIQGLEAMKLKPAGPARFQSPGSGLGISTRQVIPLEGLAEGETAIRLLYRRPWVESRVPKMEIILRAAEISLVSDLSNPEPLTGPAPEAAVREGLLAGTPNLGLPASFDWRNSGILTPVRDQGNCGSCWAFGTVGPFEANLKWKSSLTTDLSEEFLLSCNTDGYSCNGGWWAHEYHHTKTAVNQTQPGAVLETDFPYTAAAQSCNRQFDHPYRVGNWSYVGDDSSTPSAEAIKNAIYSYGPVAVAVCAGPNMQGYRGGVFSIDEKSFCGGGVNHAVVLVGWNDADNTWIMRNSWGDTWGGDGGYMRITWGTSNIGYSANHVIYAAPFTATHWTFFPLAAHNPWEPPPATPVRNGDFEAGLDGSWAESSTNGYTLVMTQNSGLPVTPHSGSWAAWLGGADFEISLLAQRIQVPDNALTLSFWYWIGSEDLCGYDFAGVQLGSDNVQAYELCGNTNGWLQETVDIKSFRGQTRDLIFRVVTDEVLNSNFFLDDVVLSTTTGERLPLHFSPAVGRSIDLPKAPKRR